MAAHHTQKLVARTRTLWGCPPPLFHRSANQQEEPSAPPCAPGCMRATCTRLRWHTGRPRCTHVEVLPGRGL
eukprot:11713238-Alexandrium_andersonii.AAC.1